MMRTFQLHKQLIEETLFQSSQNFNSIVYITEVTINAYILLKFTRVKNIISLMYFYDN